MINILPVPKEITTEGEVGSCKLQICSSVVGFHKRIEGLKKIAQQVYDRELVNGDGGIVVYKDSDLATDAYAIETQNGHINVFASSEEGLGYAFATIFQIASLKGKDLHYPICKIFDKPDCNYRGLMVDVSRQHHDIEELLAYVNICFLYKIKYLHIHFIDDQAYTLPSRVLDNISSTDHYTFEEIEKLVNFAKERNVELVPEIETIGHCICFLDKYPEIFDLKPIEGKSYDDFSINGVAKRNNVVCAGSSQVRDYMKRFIDEIIEMFPYSEYIHIGGDEASILALDTCSVCVDYMKEKGLKSSNELFGEYLGFLANHVIDRGKKPMVWEGFSKEIAHFIPKETLVIAWESYYNYCYDLIADGFNIINCTWKPLYITTYYWWGIKEIKDWNIYSWRHWWKESKAYGKGIDIPETDKVLGGQLCSWECRYEQEYDNIKRNLIVVSNNTWNKSNNKISYSGKLQKLNGLIKKLNKSYER